MPFKSKSQMKALYAKDPKVAKEFAGKTKNMKDLPEKVVKKNPKVKKKVMAAKNKPLQPIESRRKMK